MIPELCTDRLLLREMNHADFDTFAAVHGAPEHARFIGGACDRNQAWRRFAAMLGHWTLRGFGMWAIEEWATGKFAGCAGLWYPEGWDEVELGYWLTPEMTGKGYATEAATAARKYASQTLGHRRLASYIHPDNAASIAVAERLGAKPEGVLEGGDLDGHILYRHPKQ